MDELPMLGYVATIARRSAGVLIGPGDDCALVRTGERTLVTVDQVIEGRHFDVVGLEPSREVLDLIARKAMARSFSDIAAMAGEPSFAVATAAFGQGFSQEGAEYLAKRLHDWGEELVPGCCVPVVGGDVATTSGPLVVTVTMLGGLCENLWCVRRSGAKSGDLVYVTGRLGGSFASGRHLRFEPRVREGMNLLKLLRGDLHAMMDLSDGLGLDSDRMGKASGVCLEIDAARLPCHAGVTSWRQGAGEGEDYELLFTAPADSPVPLMCPGTSTPLTCVGQAVEVRDDRPAGSVIITPEGERIAGATLGWKHG